MRALVAVLLALLVVLQYRLWLAEGGLVEVHRLEQQVAAQAARNERLRERNRALAAEVRDLKQGLDAVEARARAELGMVREGETFYQVVEPADGTRGGRGE
ncbi:MAG: cell division protein FtsB [Halofilum sp. (in: g-proteobacteria)]|nr:cell division protein FtsB [Halofilum sp. (in: g-proteobacteria)]